MTTEPWGKKYVDGQRAAGNNPDRLEVCVTIWATFDNFISFEQAMELGEDGGELAGLKQAWREFVKDERNILNALGNADKMEYEWEVEPR